MSHIETAMWAVTAAVGATVLLLLVSGIARSCGWHETESWAKATGMLIVFVLVGGVLALVVVAGMAYFHAQL